MEGEGRETCGKPRTFGDDPSFRGLSPRLQIPARRPMGRATRNGEVEGRSPTMHCDTDKSGPDRRSRGGSARGEFPNGFEEGHHRRTLGRLPPCPGRDHDFRPKNSRASVRGRARNQTLMRVVERARRRMTRDFVRKGGAFWRGRNCASSCAAHAGTGFPIPLRFVSPGVRGRLNVNPPACTSHAQRTFVVARSSVVPAPGDA
jgi:hypothetical protein